MKRAAKGELNWCGTQFPPGRRPGCGDEPARVRGFRLQRRAARQAPTPSPPGRRSASASSAWSISSTARRSIAWSPPTAPTCTMSVAGMTLDQLRRPRELPRRRGLHRPGPRRRQRARRRQLQLPRRPSRPRGARCRAEVPRRQGGRCLGRQGRGVPDLDARHGRRQPHASASAPSAPTTTSASTPATPSSMKRSAAPSTSPSAPAIPKPATPTSPACTGTWSATSAPPRRRRHHHRRRRSVPPRRPIRLRRLAGVMGNGRCAMWDGRCVICELVIRIAIHRLVHAQARAERVPSGGERRPGFVSRLCICTSAATSAWVRCPFALHSMPSASAGSRGRATCLA